VTEQNWLEVLEIFSVNVQTQGEMKMENGELFTIRYLMVCTFHLNSQGLKRPFHPEWRIL
jgi:hypothetical protein